MSRASSDGKVQMAFLRLHPVFGVTLLFIHNMVTAGASILYHTPSQPSTTNLMYVLEI